MEHGFTEGGSLARMRLALPRTEAASLAESLRAQTAGAVAPREVEDLVLYHPFP